MLGKAAPVGFEPTPFRNGALNPALDRSAKVSCFFSKNPNVLYTLDIPDTTGLGISKATAWATASTHGRSSFDFEQAPASLSLAAQHPQQGRRSFADLALQLGLLHDMPASTKL